jgi:predicted AlkP superfamily pyrophosphatase or phosphodiesterase
LHSHPFSPNSTQVVTQIENLDKLVGYLLEQLVKFNLTEAVNDFLLSDHGMDSTDEEHIIDLTSFTNASTYFSVGSSPVVHIFPNKGMF